MDTTVDSSNSSFEQSLEKQTAPIEKIDVHYAGFWIRFWAYLIDLIVITSINRIIIYPILTLIGADTSNPSMFSPVTLLSSITFFLYFVLMTKYLQQTLGKMVLGLKVKTLDDEPLTWGTVIFREFIGRYISKTFGGFLYIVTAFTPKKQGLHDIFADTTVIHEKLYTMTNSENKRAE
ncbi:RDD family protein [Metabacillus fastidiosus]|uniref:RDD family protein n=1 Tax=Metabacillus fastidiosus TaxID=1458 RepID=UPI003D2C13BE